MGWSTTFLIIQPHRTLLVFALSTMNGGGWGRATVGGWGWGEGGPGSAELVTPTGRSVNIPPKHTVPTAEAS